MQAVYRTTALGVIGIEEEAGALTQLFFAAEHLAQEEGRKRESPLAREAFTQLEQYLQGQRRTFELPLAPRGTPFQQRVWAALREIPYGDTWSYKQVALRIGNGKACRAVGMANNRNPIAIIIPCHRVIGANGALVGYGGGLHYKEWLLQLEQG